MPGMFERTGISGAFGDLRRPGSHATERRKAKIKEKDGQKNQGGKKNRKQIRNSTPESYAAAEC
jgi:hypothetical protein